MATLLESGLAKFEKKTLKLLPREMTEVIKNLGSLTAEQKRGFKAYLQRKTTVLSSIQEKNLIDSDPKFALTSLRTISAKNQAYVLKAYNSFRGMMFKRMYGYDEWNEDILPSVLRHKDTTERFAGKLLYYIEDQKHILSFFRKFPNCHRYLDFPLEVDEETQLELIKINPRVIKKIYKPTEAALELAEARATRAKAKIQPKAKKEIVLPAAETDEEEEEDSAVQIQTQPKKPKTKTKKGGAKTGLTAKQGKEIDLGESDLDESDETETETQPKKPKPKTRNRRGAKIEVDDELDTDESNEEEDDSNEAVDVDSILIPEDEDRPTKPKRVLRPKRDKILTKDDLAKANRERQQQRELELENARKRAEEEEENQDEDDFEEGDEDELLTPADDKTETETDLEDNDENEELEVEDKGNVVPADTQEEDGGDEDQDYDEDEEGELNLDLDEEDETDVDSWLEELGETALTDEEDKQPKIIKPKASVRSKKDKAKEEGDSTTEDVSEIVPIAKPAADSDAKPEDSKEQKEEIDVSSIKVGGRIRRPSRRVKVQTQDQDQKQEQPQTQPETKNNKPKEDPTVDDSEDSDLEDLDLDIDNLDDLAYDEDDDDQKDIDFHINHRSGDSSVKTEPELEPDSESDLDSDESLAKPSAEPIINAISADDEKKFVNLLRFALKKLLRDTKFIEGRKDLSSAELKTLLLRTNKLSELVNNDLVDKFQELDYEDKEDIFETAFPASSISLNGLSLSASVLSLQQFLKFEAPKLKVEIDKLMRRKVLNKTNELKNLMRKFGVQFKSKEIKEYEVKGGLNEAWIVQGFLNNPKEALEIYIDPHLNNVKITRA